MRAIVASILILGILLIGGCQRTLFAEKQPRTQFENYNRMRQRYTPMQERDVFGNPQPALRARLAQPG
jgi:hypothetical protein